MLYSTKDFEILESYVEKAFQKREHSYVFNFHMLPYSVILFLQTTGIDPNTIRSHEEMAFLLFLWRRGYFID
jgi:hypothetical protein